MAGKKSCHSSRIAAVAAGFRYLPAQTLLVQIFLLTMTILLENLAAKWLYRAGSCRYPAETLLYCNLGSSKWFVCVRMCVHDPCLSAQACVGVQMQAWKGNGVFFVLKSWYSGVSVGILHKINWQMIAKDQLGSHLRDFLNGVSDGRLCW